MKRTLFIIAVLSLGCASYAQIKGNPGSLFDPKARNMFTDNVAREVGDVLLVVVDEKTIADFSASTQASKNDSNSISTKFFNNFLDRLFRPLTTGDQSSNSGDGETKQNSRMSATMSVIVKQVLPNGNMVIEGSRSLITNKQTQTLTLSGVIRPLDIRPDNSVLSSVIAEAQIKMDGAGLISQRQHKGILTKILDWLF
ncbi:MAG TPA: flagellar basal body L-ring protein FlgH [Fimbriimonadaceae bacterium]|nr:flagellar basal body L-ring protein FlgH [Fimbriimonadaceae bacterium]